MFAGSEERTPLRATVSPAVNGLSPEVRVRFFGDSFRGGDERAPAAVASSRNAGLTSAVAQLSPETLGVANLWFGEVLLTNMTASFTPGGPFTHSDTNRPRRGDLTLKTAAN